MLSGFLVTTLLGNLLSPVLGLRGAPGSPCADICRQPSFNTTPSEIVCVDTAYNRTTRGRRFESCVSCELKSTYYDYSSGQADVDWGLYNLRYAFTSCVFGYPVSVTNISSPCPVSCETIIPAIEEGLLHPNSFNFASWCNAPSYADNVINTCEQCYNETLNQVYLANFLEAIRYNCHYPTVPGHSFKIAPSRIFSEVLLPSSESVGTPTPGGSGGSNVNLPLVIAVPIVGFIILVGSMLGCCYCFYRWRRKRATKKRLEKRYDEQLNELAMQSQQWGDPQMNPALYEQQMQAAQYAGFNFVDTNGQAQPVGYAYYPNQMPGFSEDVSETPAANTHVNQVASHAVEPEK